VTSRRKPSPARPPVDRFVAFEQAALVESYISSYFAWRKQTAEVQTAYERWTSGGVDSHAAFTLYRAELMLEERSAQAYQECTQRLVIASAQSTP
jgi:hypothetical protein